MEATVDNNTLQRLYALPFTDAMRQTVLYAREGDDPRKSATRVAGAWRDARERSAGVTDDDLWWLFHQRGFTGTRFVWGADDPLAAWRAVLDMVKHFGVFVMGPQSDLRVELSSCLRAIHRTPWGGKAGRTDHRTMSALAGLAWLHGSRVFTVGDRTLAQHALADRGAVAGEKGRPGSISRLAARGFVERMGQSGFGTTYQLPDNLLERLQSAGAPRQSGVSAVRPYTDSPKELKTLKIINGVVSGRDTHMPTAEPGLSYGSLHEPPSLDWKPSRFSTWRLIHPAFHHSTKLDFQLYAALEDSILPVSSIAKLIGKHRTTAQTNLERLEAAGLVTKLPTGGWRANHHEPLLHRIANVEGVWPMIVAQIANDAFETAIGGEREREQRGNVFAAAMRQITADPSSFDGAVADLPPRLSQRDFVAQAVQRFEAIVEHQKTVHAAQKAREEAYEDRQRELRRQEREEGERRRTGATLEEIDEALGEFA